MSGIMIDIEESEFKYEVLRDMRRRLDWLRRKHPMGQRLMDEVNNLFVHTRESCARHGIAFPVMAAIVLPSANVVEIMRADLDHAQIEAMIVKIIRAIPGLDTVELVNAVKVAFPDYRPRRLGRSWPS